MQVVFLGGADGIGASCLAVQIAQRWVLVDAGIRMQPHEDRLPDLAFLQDKPLAAIFVTHAHADHIGALPLVQQSFPAVPIYTSRATMLLMEVMLADALQIMTRRASDALEVPLYDDVAVDGTLQMLRPLPLTGKVTIPELPGVTVHTARAGHVAGAMSIGLESADGRLVVSGDVSVTPQRTVPGAALVGLRHPDLMILESTYGARLHPNRQTEEVRLAQTVAEVIAGGGHALIPAFALGRAQEVLQILHNAQRRGQIAEFPIWVDGLVRTVCNVYTAIPEALTNTLERQIRKGYAPFFAGQVRAVNSAAQRERIVDGSPACIVSSSGMLTGGPSAFYAARLADKPENAILITGYQDEEAPGRKLLALADAGGGILELDGQTVQVRCQFGRYSLSAHADGSELAGMVGALKPQTVALVHGEQDARSDLAQRLERLAEVVLPIGGQKLEVSGGRAKGRGSRSQKPRRKTGFDQPAGTSTVSAAGVGHGEPFTSAGVSQLWQAISDDSGDQVVSFHELALAWYGTAADAAAGHTVQQVLEQEQPYFVPHPDLPAMVRVRTAAEVATAGGTTTQARNPLQPGALLLLRTFNEKLLPVVCLDVRAEMIRGVLPAGEGQRSSFPRATVLEVVGALLDATRTERDALREQLSELQRAAQQWTRLYPLRRLVGQMQPGQAYRINELCETLELAADDLAARLGVALLLNSHSEVVQREVALVAHAATYVLQADEGVAEAIEASDPRPDQMAILATIERHIGQPTDLYKRSVNPETGAVVLAFHFPAIAQQHYGAALEAAAAEAGVPITIGPNPHQGELQKLAQSLLPEVLSLQKTSLAHDRTTITLRVRGSASAEAVQAASEQFYRQTGWTLQIDQLEQSDLASQPSQPKAATAAHLAANGALDMNQALNVVREMFAACDEETGFYKVGADQSSYTLVIRFHFPTVARERYAELLADIAARTGWQVMVYPEPHQGALEAMVRQVLPPELEPIGAVSLYREQQHVSIQVRGQADETQVTRIQQVFAAETGWNLQLKIEPTR